MIGSISPGSRLAPRIVAFTARAGAVGRAAGRLVAGLMRPWIRSDPLPSRPLVVTAAATIAGSALPLLAVPDGWSVAVPSWLIAGVALGGWRWLARRGRPRAAAAALLAAIACAASAWSAARFGLFPADDLAWSLGEFPVPVAVRGRLVEPPLLLPSPATDPRRAGAIGPSSECTVAIEAVRDGADWRPASGRAVVVVGAAPASIVVGSRVSLLGRGLRPAPALNPGEPDPAARGRAERRLSIIRVDSWACVRVEARPAWWCLAAAVDRLRVRGAAALAAHVSPDRRPLAAALLLGDRHALARDDVDAYQATGTIHVLAISGLHVGLLAAGLFGLLRTILLPRTWACLVVACVVGAYMLVVGAGTPVVRATLQIWLVCGGAALRRRPSTLNSLAGAALVVCVWRPADVLSPGAQLSFLSTAVLVGAARGLAVPPATDPVERLIERSRSRWEKGLRGGVRWAINAFVLGAAVWLATAPLVAHRFHLVSPVGLVVNVLLAPLVTLAMACGFACLVLGDVVPPLAAVCGAGCDWSLLVMGGIVDPSARLPGGHVWVSGPPTWWVAGWYAGLGLVAVLANPGRLRRPAVWIGPALAWGVVGFVLTAGLGCFARRPAGLEVTVAAVGHGCGIVVRSPAGRCLVYDAGRLGGPGAARRSLAAILWMAGTTRIDSLVLSHADADHFNAVPELLPRFTVGEVVVTEAFLASPAPAVADLLERLARRRIPVRTVRAGDSFAIDPLCRARVLHGGDGRAGGGGGTDNESSLVLAVEAAGRRVLLTGDLEGPALAGFVAAGPGACDVLVAPHHGTATSLPPDIARATAPSCVLVSGRGGPRWPAVREAYAAAVGGRRPLVLKTGGEGAITVTLTADAVRTARFSAGRWTPVPDPAFPAGRQAADAARADDVSVAPAAIRSSWLTTYAPRSMSTPLVNP